MMHLPADTYNLIFTPSHKKCLICRYESTENMSIQVSTKVCSFGKQVVEKVETEHPRYEGGRYLYKIHRSPMCEYMINFILKLKHLPEKYMMNSVLVLEAGARRNATMLEIMSALVAANEPKSCIRPWMLDSGCGCDLVPAESVVNLRK